MAENLFNKLNPSELKREINERVEKETRSLPHNAKVFAAIAAIQGFDSYPDLVPPADLNGLIEAGRTELFRGVVGLKGVSVRVFAEDLLRGTMCPGTQSAIGTGIHFAIPSMKDPENSDFPHMSQIAVEYATGQFGGAITRAAIDPQRAKDCRELLQINRDYKASARKAGIMDVGALAAAYGVEAFFAERHYDHVPEDIWVVLNRGALTFQNSVLLTKPIATEPKSS